LTSLDISSNSIGMLTLPQGWQKHPTQQKYKSPDGKVQDTAPEGSAPEGIIAIANVIPDMRAILSLNLAKNKIGGWEAETGVQALADMLQVNSTITDLNISENRLDGECIKILAPVISGNGAMTSLNLASNELGVKGAKIIAACLPKCL
jgi:hypothetical protein